MQNKRGPDPNKDRNDPMIPEHWELGEQIQNRIRKGGFESDEVEGIAVDIHDILQAADAIRERLAPAVVTATPEQLAGATRSLAAELDHIRWHCNAAIDFLDAASPK